MTDHSELKRLAEAATPGPWAGQHDVYSDNGQGERICKMATAEDSAFISAANPTVVLALIAEIEVLTSTGKFLGAGVDMLGPRCDQLRVEVEALRKDAERYRFLKARTQQADIELAVCLHDKRTQVTVFLDGEYVDSQTDIAMNQGVKP